MHSAKPPFIPYHTFTRRHFGQIMLSSTVIALPTGRLLAAEDIKALGEMATPEDPIDPDIVVDDTVKGSIKSKATDKTHKKGPTTANYLSDGIGKINCNRKLKKGEREKYDGTELPEGETILPKDGQMGVLIDYKGNWVFSASFPPQKMPANCDVAVGLGLKSSVGQVIAFRAHAQLRGSGDNPSAWNYQKQGHAAIVEDLWKNVVKGHEFRGSWAARQIPPRAVATGNSGGGGGGGDTGSEVLSDVSTGLTILGTILAFF
jgi:hypothetical protein